MDGPWEVVPRALLRHRPLPGEGALRPHHTHTTPHPHLSCPTPADPRLRAAPRPGYPGAGAQVQRRGVLWEASGLFRPGGDCQDAHSQRSSAPQRRRLLLRFPARLLPHMVRPFSACGPLRAGVNQSPACRPPGRRRRSSCSRVLGAPGKTTLRPPVPKQRARPLS